MTKKFTKDEYFAAVSALDLWILNLERRVDSACRVCGADAQVFWNIFVVGRELDEDDLPDEILIQVGCELAGL